MESDEREQAQRERATGAYALWIDRRPEDAGAWKVLRRTLRFSRADEPWLERTVPGPVRRGARADPRPVLERLQEAGIQASLRPSESLEP